MPLVLAPFLIPGLVLIAALVLLALSHAFNAWFGSTSQSGNSGGLVGALNTILLAPIHVITGTAQKIARTTVSHWALAHVKPVTRWFNALSFLAGWQFTETAAIAEDTAHALERLTGVTIPREVETKLKPVQKDVQTANLHAETAIAREHALSSTFTRTHAAQVRLNVHYTHAIDSALPQRLGRIETKNRTQDGAIDTLKDGVRGLEDGAIATFKWLSAHRTSAAMGVFAGAVAWALSHLGYGFLRCRSWQNLGRQMKCSDANVLRDLLIGATAVAASMSLIELAREEQKVVGALSTVVRDFWQV